MKRGGEPALSGHPGDAVFAGGEFDGIMPDQGAGRPRRDLIG